MLSPAEIDGIKKDIARLEKARDRCTDTGIRKLTEAWIEEARNKLAKAAKKDS
jgi:hypothetical protein